MINDRDVDQIGVRQTCLYGLQLLWRNKGWVVLYALLFSIVSELLSLIFGLATGQDGADYSINIHTNLLGLILINLLNYSICGMIAARLFLREVEAVRPTARMRFRFWGNGFKWLILVSVAVSLWDWIEPRNLPPFMSFLFTVPDMMIEFIAVGIFLFACMNTWLSAGADFKAVTPSNFSFSLIFRVVLVGALISAVVGVPLEWLMENSYDLLMTSAGDVLGSSLIVLVFIVIYASFLLNIILYLGFVSAFVLALYLRHPAIVQKKGGIEDVFA